MHSSFINLLPMIILALGAIVSIALEPLLRNTNKHRILPWVSASFIVIAAIPFFFAVQDSLYGVLAMDPIRRLLGWTILFCSFLGIGGVQWTLAREKYRGGEAYGLLMLAASGALCMTQAIDFLALFIGMELAAFPIYALVGLRRKDRGGNEAVFKYFISGAVFSVIFLYGVSLIYGATGSTHFGNAVLEGRNWLYVAGLFLVLFGLLFKAGAAPVHFWVADVYTGAPVSITAFMAAVVKVGALAAIGSVWLFAVAAPSSVEVWNLAQTIQAEAFISKPLELFVLAVAFLSIIIGAFSGLAQKSIRRILAFSAVMNAGFIALGLLLPNFASGSVQLGPMYFFLITYAIASAGALTGIAYFSGNQDEWETLDNIRGLGRENPLVGFGVIVCLASLAGLPPVAGFLAKFTIFAGLFGAKFYVFAIIGFLLSIVAAVYYLRIAYVLFAAVPTEKEVLSHCSLPLSRSFLLKVGVTLAAIAVLIMGVFPAIGLIV
jgi:NADH-quinone oxidoreductase subunit N